MGLFNKLFGGGKKRPSQPSWNFTNSDARMDEEMFWEIIQTTKDRSNNDYEQQQDELASELRKLTPDEIILFANRFRYPENRQTRGNCGALSTSFMEAAEMIVSTTSGNGLSAREKTSITERSKTLRRSLNLIRTASKKWSGEVWAMCHLLCLKNGQVRSYRALTWKIRSL